MGALETWVESISLASHVHRFEPRFDRLERTSNANLKMTGMLSAEEWRRLAVLVDHVYVRDVCRCGATIERRRVPLEAPAEEKEKNDV